MWSSSCFRNLFLLSAFIIFSHVVSVVQGINEDLSPLNILTDDLDEPLIIFLLAFLIALLRFGEELEVVNSLSLGALNLFESLSITVVSGLASEFNEMSLEVSDSFPFRFFAPMLLTCSSDCSCVSDVTFQLSGGFQNDLRSS